MIKYLQRFPTTLDIEILYFLSNLWWLVVFISPPGIFSGIAYDRAIFYLGQPFIVSLLATLLCIGLLAFSKRQFIVLALITGPIVYTYFGVVSLVGTRIALNAAVLLFIAIYGAYRLLSYTLHK